MASGMGIRKVMTMASVFTALDGFEPEPAAAWNKKHSLNKVSAKSKDKKKKRKQAKQAKRKNR